ncbi:hypothetical protein [Paraclostridium sordellii]|uniref:Uncharacterized protein n=1 Tax=Paraclostridium sordellii TaxID=1505 RepID=A0A0C7Q3J1_PARSO|nr:hypothetical protein [Paeniclostridium sordellii]QYE99176.1 hypothetical protein KZ987_06605 [Paeniclostridium sordellii]CEN77969.1 Uncharacterised protein [[Clostridium] sordellii] [Paeniclostridium sordellii]CEO07087.1 Uncharacterised protein [[Clostridium] sordellii] [Paeniclostridium sordellii]CEP86773.1 Uncharacterised protein [[Clostridium] sordellii] [Paeniclostridium sordellii]CEP97651.1 Uncharacterised protein [[Clostridium] sordellii] [Paeniclostridium sordellii]
MNKNNKLKKEEKLDNLNKNIIFSTIDNLSGEIDNASENLEVYFELKKNKI